MFFISLQKLPYIFTLLIVFTMNGCCIFSNAFPASTELIILFFSPLIYEHELLNWFSNTEKIIPCIPRIYTTCLWNINLLCIVEMLSISLYWPIVFFSYADLIGILYQNYAIFIKLVPEYFLFWKFFAIVFGRLESFFLWVFCKTHVAPEFSLWNNI